MSGCLLGAKASKNIMSYFLSFSLIFSIVSTLFKKVIFLSISTSSSVFDLWIILKISSTLPIILEKFNFSRTESFRGFGSIE